MYRGYKFMLDVYPVQFSMVFYITHLLTEFQIINSLWPNDAIWRHRSGSTLAQVMACCLAAPSHYLNQSYHPDLSSVVPSDEGMAAGSGTSLAYKQPIHPGGVINQVCGGFPRQWSGQKDWLNHMMYGAFLTSVYCNCHGGTCYGGPYWGCAAPKGHFLSPDSFSQWCIFGKNSLTKDIFFFKNSSKSHRNGLMIRKFSLTKGVISTKFSLAKGIRSKSGQRWDDRRDIGLLSGYWTDFTNIF